MSKNFESRVARLERKRRPLPELEPPVFEVTCGDEVSRIVMDLTADPAFGFRRPRPAYHKSDNGEDLE